MSDDAARLDALVELMRATFPEVESNGTWPTRPDDVVDPDAIIFETLRAFLERDLPPSVSLVGTPRDGTNLLPQFGWVMPWGRAGSGKTSILVDLLFHAAAGIDWLAYQITRPLRIVAIVNEGIPGGLQDKFRQKLERWDGDSDAVQDNLAVYASPWGEFTFANAAMVEHAHDYAHDFGADYVALDPLHTLGTSGSGAPNETEAFKHLLRDFGVWDDLGVITSHHANKAGMVSGDWTRHPDTVFHVEKDGPRPATKFTLEKARPADPGEHGVPVLLEWLVDTFGYRRVELPTAPPFDEDGTLVTVLDVLAEASKPLGKDALVKLVGGTNERVREVVERAIVSGAIIDLTPERRSFRLVLPTLVPSESADGTLFDDAQTVASAHVSTEPDGTLVADAQTGMVERTSSVDDEPTEPDATGARPGESSVPSASAPSLEGDDVADATNGGTDDAHESIPNPLL